MSTEGRRLLVCYHEAGHAVVRWWLGHRNDNAIVISRAAFLAGQTIPDRRGRPQRAEGIVNGYDLVERGMLRVFPNDTDMEKQRARELYEARVRMSVVEIYAGPIAEAVFRKKSLSWCLFEGGGGDVENATLVTDECFSDEAEAEQAHVQALHIARLVVRSPKGRAAISAVASALHERGELDGAEIASMCVSAYGGEPAHDAWALRWPPTPKEIRSGFLPQREA